MKRAVRVLLACSVVLLSGCMATGEDSTPNAAADPATTPRESPETDDTLSRLESRALTVAYGSHDKASRLQYLYNLCHNQKPRFRWWVRTAPTSSSLFREARAASLLCPDWSMTPLVTRLYEAAEALDRLRQNGRVFEDGSYLVGPEIKPGTYYVTTVTSCQWARLNKMGNVIKEQSFAFPTAKVQITIYPSDYSFSSEHCGEWRPPGY